MKIVIAGGTGFLGSRLAASFSADSHDVVILTRGTTTTKTAAAAAGHLRAVAWSPTGEAGSWAAEIDGAAALVNLAGESIAGRRWSAPHKARILESRIHATRSLAAAIGRASAPPGVWVSGSAVGYYGPLGDEPATEERRAGADFLASVCVQWEQEALRASDRTRVVCIRTGLVLAREGGALPEMLPPFRIGVGGPVGSGRQYWPWIHVDDWVGLVRWAVTTTAVSGPLNTTAPNPVTNREFAAALGRAMHRPAFLPAPAFALRLLLGEMADALLLSGQRAIPAKAERLGYRFRFKNVDDALNQLFA
jgi:uncharacterized protein